MPRASSARLITPQGAARETTTLIESSISAVNHGEAIARKTSLAFEDVASKVHEVVSTVNEIYTASDAQALSIKQISAGIEQISSVVQTNSATSEESAAASEELSGQANMLDSLVAQFKLIEDQSIFIETPIPEGSVKYMAG